MDNEELERKGLAPVCYSVALEEAPMSAREKPSDLFALAVHIYLLLMHGNHPFMRGRWVGQGDQPDALKLARTGDWAGGPSSRLMTHPLPGNVRQLRNVARHLVISNRALEAPAVTAAVERQLRDSEDSRSATYVPIEAAPGRDSRPSRPPAIDDATLLRALRENGWSPNRTAASLGIPTGTLHDLMRKSPSVRRAASSTLPPCSLSLPS